MDQVEVVKSKVDIASLVGEYINLKSSGKNLKGLCPFHQEKTPSFMVNEDLQIYKCFGCGKGGDAISFVMEIEGLEFFEALEKLADRVGVKLDQAVRGEKTNKSLVYEINKVSGEYYNYLLTSHPLGEQPREYLHQRKINDKLIKTFSLGYALPTWDGLCIYLTKKKRFPIDVVVDAGLAIKGNSGVYDRFRGRLMFPFVDMSGRVVGFSGRVIPGISDDKDGAKYINTPETVVYRKSEVLFGLEQAKQAIRNNNRVVVVEGPMDMISSYGAGVSETVAINGTALTGRMLALISRLCNRIYLCMDADGAGEASIKRSISELESFELSTKVVEVVGGKDPDEVARSKPEKWKKMVDAAVEIYDYFIDRALVKWKVDSGEGVRNIAKEVLPLLAQIGNSVVQAHYIGVLSSKLRMGEQKLWEQLERVKKTTNLPTNEVTKSLPVQKDEDRVEGLTKELLSVLMNMPKLSEFTREVESLKKITWTGGAGKVIEVILRKNGVGEVGRFVENLPAELRNIAGEAYLAEQGGAETVEATLIQLTREIGIETAKRELERLSQRISQKELAGDDKEVAKLLQEYRRLSLQAK